MSFSGFVNKVIHFVKRWKYEVLLIALLQHLFIGIFLFEFQIFEDILWPLSLIVIGTTGVFMLYEDRKWNIWVKILSLIIAILIPLNLQLLSQFILYIRLVDLVYFVFFTALFIKVIRFLISPGYINLDIISASACGYFLLIETNIFFIQGLMHFDSFSIENVSTANPAATFIDLVYLCTIIQATIGFGDIVPITSQAKLVIALFGVLGQFYSVVLVGILISKFSAKSDK